MVINAQSHVVASALIPLINNLSSLNVLNHNFWGIWGICENFEILVLSRVGCQMIQYND